MYDEEEINLDTFENYLTKPMTRAKRRRTDRSKALSKARKASHIYRSIPAYYGNLHQYSKNKIYCSCPMCACKTNTDVYKSKGPIGFQFIHTWKDELGKIRRYEPTREARQTMTCGRHGKKNYKISDLRKIEKAQYQLTELSIDDIIA